jgi:hypothetical protein
VLFVPALAGIATQTRRLDQAEQQARLLIQLWARAKPDSFDITVNTRSARDFSSDPNVKEGPTRRNEFWS